MTSSPLPRVHVIGMGEVGGRLAGALARAGTPHSPVTRTQGWDDALAADGDLRMVCVREEDLGAVLERLASVPPEHIILVQNGWIRPLLEDGSRMTRGLIWFTSKGDFFRILRPSPLTGTWGAALAEALTAGGIPSTAVDRGSFAGLEAEKMGFNCIVGLPLAVHDVALGEYIDRYRSEAQQLFTESVTACALALEVRAQPGWWDAFLISVDPLRWVRTSTAKALPFRNQAVADLAAAHGLEVPATMRLLTAWRDRLSEQSR